MSALGSGRACSPWRSPPTVHCLSQCPAIVLTASVLCARSLPNPLSSHPLRSDLGLWTRGLYWVRRAYQSVVSPTLCVLIAAVRAVGGGGVHGSGYLGPAATTWPLGPSFLSCLSGSWTFEHLPGGANHCEAHNSGVTDQCKQISSRHASLRNARRSVIPPGVSPHGPRTAQPPMVRSASHDHPEHPPPPGKHTSTGQTQQI